MFRDLRCQGGSGGSGGLGVFRVYGCFGGFRGSGGDGGLGGLGCGVWGWGLASLHYIRSFELNSNKGNNPQLQGSPKTILHL